MASGTQLPIKLLMGTARLASMTWPVASAFFPETLEVDDNQSFWVSQSPPYTPGAPLRTTIDADLAIIGGGFTGISTAYHFSRRYPEKRVVLLEAKTLANGASGRNGGMLLNWLSDHTGYSDEMLAKVYQMTSQGIQMILDIIHEHRLDVSYRLDGTLQTYTDTQRAEAAHAETEQLNALGIPVQYLDSAALRDKLHLQGVEGAVLDPATGQINGVQLVRSLRPVLVRQGVEIYEGTPVLKIREGRTITLTTPEGEVRAKAIVLATNGYTGKLGYFQDALFPLHSHVFATAPLLPEQQAGFGWRAFAGYSDDLDRISYSVITREGNIVFGGGSNQSYAYLFKNRTAYPGTPDSARHAFEKVRATMTEYFPQTPSLPVTHRWTGTLGITLRRNWLLGVRGENRNVYYSIGYCGHGVTLANVAGKIVTQMFSGDDEAYRDLPFYQADYGRIPPEPFRWMGYQFFTRLTGKSPRI
jgi:glycine/D-amino acid oxidase-like deaminating enzyme